MTKKPDNKSGELEDYTLSCGTDKYHVVVTREDGKIRVWVNDKGFYQGGDCSPTEEEEAALDQYYQGMYYKLQQENEQLKKELDKYKWIPVSERLPEEDGLYEVTIKSVFKDTQPYTYRSIYKTYYPERDKDVVGWQHPGVIAWKEHPEPDPPKPEEDEG